MAQKSSADQPSPQGATDPEVVAQRYSKLGAKGITVSSDPRADVTFSGSPLEGWLVAAALLLAGCVSMGIYLIVLHH